MIDFLSSFTQYQRTPLYLNQIFLQVDSTALNVLNLVSQRPSFCYSIAHSIVSFANGNWKHYNHELGQTCKCRYIHGSAVLPDAVQLMNFPPEERSQSEQLNTQWLCFSFISRSLAPWDVFFHGRTSFPSPPLSFEWCSRSPASVINISDSIEMFCWSACWMLFLFIQTFLSFSALVEGFHGTSVMLQPLGRLTVTNLCFFGFFKLNSSLPVLADLYCFTILKEWATLTGVVTWDVAWLKVKQKGEAEYWRVQGQVLKGPNKTITALSYVWSFNIWTCIPQSSGVCWWSWELLVISVSWLRFLGLSV